ncbi:MAG TPA: phosphoribosyltransferase family protein [Verrucomicrobiae bacterium]|nr:phosphoribosyltransferase family protein [Verrucomicrobiae bacterium]
MAYFSLYSLSEATHSAELDLNQFSQFKHGSGAAAQRFGRAMSAYLAESAPVVFEPEVVLIASCYKYAPVAAQALADETMLSLNELRITKGLPAIKRGRIYRGEVFEIDYSALSDADRKALLANDALLVDVELMKGKHVIVIDDVRITGGHERKIDPVLAEIGAASVTYVYLAAFNEMPQSATIERELNHATVKTPANVFALASQPDFRLNSRVVKFLLGASTAEELIQNLAPDALLDFYKAALGNGYALMPRFHETLKALRVHLYDVLNPDVAEATQVYLPNVTSLYDITGEAAEAPFASLYSQYKYGSVEAAKKLGIALGAALWNQDEHLKAESVTVMAPATGNVPIGATLLVDWASFYINDRRFALEVGPVTISKLTRSIIPAGDYGTLSAEERASIMTQATVSEITEHIAGEHVIIIDDLWVTGVSAQTTIDQLTQAGCASYRYAVVAVINQQDAANDPALEARLNHVAVSTVHDLVGLYAQTAYVVNQRVCKFLLSAKNTSQILELLEPENDVLRQKVVAACIEDNLHQSPEYTASFAVLSGKGSA